MISAPAVGERAVELREAQVVADRHARRGGRARPPPRPRRPAPWRPTRDTRRRRRPRRTCGACGRRPRRPRPGSTQRRSCCAPAGPPRRPRPRSPPRSRRRGRRAQPCAARSDGPSSGSAPSRSRGPWMNGHFSGRTTRRAPAAAAAPHEAVGDARGCARGRPSWSSGRRRPSRRYHSVESERSLGGGMSAEILSQIEDVLDKIRPALHADGGDVELVDFDAGGLRLPQHDGLLRGLPDVHRHPHARDRAELRRSIPEVEGVVTVIAGPAPAPAVPGRFVRMGYHPWAVGWRGVAQLGSALRSGRRGPRFKSGHPDRTMGAPNGAPVRPGNSRLGRRSSVRDTIASQTIRSRSRSSRIGDRNPHDARDTAHTRARRHPARASAAPVARPRGAARAQLIHRPFAKHPWTFEVALFALALVDLPGLARARDRPALDRVRERRRDHQLGEELRPLRGDAASRSGC